ncbi:GntR family transcriptional regulator [Kineosporia babensis]|uniref:GntR family transcriptional regulator n=1 Tax=Kineosporia babensis TaxID=499548 RepID=A0A9X1NG42_9ACTN|nr:GntR family transcriptional regulator [Kineosporia babensis]MCD5313274.1 GntR family transcriptional regulator [Kineosporia babensis]
MPVSLHLLLADHLAARIQAGHYPPGAPLPSLPDLEHEGYPIRTARDALRRLVREGWAEQLADGGFVVAGEAPDTDWDQVYQQVETLLQAWHGKPAEPGQPGTGGVTLRGPMP